MDLSLMQRVRFKCTRRSIHIRTHLSVQTVNISYSHQIEAGMPKSMRRLLLTDQKKYKIKLITDN